MGFVVPSFLQPCHRSGSGGSLPTPQSRFLFHSSAATAYSTLSTFPRRSFFFFLFFPLYILFIFPLLVGTTFAIPMKRCPFPSPYRGGAGCAPIPTGPCPETAPGTLPNPPKEPHLGSTAEAAAPRYHQHNWKGHMLNPRCCSR